MLIIPLHRRLDRTTFPFATALLILINCFVFFFLQTGNTNDQNEAAAFYADSSLPEIEVPAYHEWLQAQGSRRTLARLEQVPESMQPMMTAMLIDTDPRFLEQFDDAANFQNTENYAAWKTDRVRYEELRGQSFTDAWKLRYGEWSLSRMFGAAFLHGGFGHLFGNMVFLALLGLLVELALGPGRFVLLYLIGALGSSAGALLWNAGEVGAGLGASGAIAALMGAFAVIWAGHKVRVFYWFFVVFNYARVQALWLLPLWLGWEVYNLLANPDAGIGFEAHAGGIITGAACGFMFAWLGWVHHERLIEQAPVVDAGDRLQLALSDMGAMRLEAADAGLSALLAEQPDDHVVQLALLRCARMAGQRTRVETLADALLSHNGGEGRLLDNQLAAIRELGHLRVNAEPDRCCRLAQRLLAAGRTADAEAAIDGLVHSDDARLPAIWLALGNARLHEDRYAAARSHLTRLVDQVPRSGDAAKARFLLDQMPPDRSVSS